ncbi:2700_t:CDS:2 [Entrophospora sp. SA101]|nr:2700_t:CDS:2 [Entrophospora sp. SA101]
MSLQRQQEKGIIGIEGTSNHFGTEINLFRKVISNRQERVKEIHVKDIEYK